MGQLNLAPSGGKALYPLIGVSKAGPSGVGFLHKDEPDRQEYFCSVYQKRGD